MAVESLPDLDGAQGVPAVAIIMRTKDRPLLLARALASVLSQRFQDWTLWLVNDGGCQDRLDQAIAPFRLRLGDRFRLLQNEVSMGMEAASNQAIEASTSTYLVVHDDDDAWHPAFLDETVAFLGSQEGNAYGGVVTWSELVRERLEGGDIVTLERRPYNQWYQRIDLQRMLGGNMFPPICFLFRRDLIARVGPFDAALPVLGDWEFNIRVLQATDIAVLPQMLAYYHQREHAGSLDIYSNSIYSGLNLHQGVDANLRNRLLRRALAQHPDHLGALAAVSRDFVQMRERLDEVERYLTFQSARVIERLNDVENYLEGRSADRHLVGVAEHTENLRGRQALTREVENLSQQIATLRHDLAGTIEAARIAQTRVTPAQFVWRSLLPIRRLVARLRGRI